MLFGSISRSRLTLAAVASKAEPSENLTPVRRVNVQLIASGASCHAVARLGWTLPLWSTLPSDSTTIDTMFDTVVVVWRIGSSVSGSTPPATVSTLVCLAPPALATLLPQPVRRPPQTPPQPNPLRPLISPTPLPPITPHLPPS